MFKENHTQKYWQYEYDVSAHYMVPLLEGWGTLLKGAELIDVGCGEAGGLCAMHDAGATCVGFDIDAPRVESAKQLKGDRAIPLTTGNLYNDSLPFDDRRFDIVVLHDVFEHLDHKERVLQKLGSYLKPDGKLLITFPPYYSAYGAHQQLLRAPFLKIPFFHLLPLALSFVLPRVKGEEPYFVEEVRKLGRLKMGMKKFEALIHKGGWSVAGKQAYIIGPNHIRFGLKPIPAGPIATIPVLNEIACTGVVYLLSRQRVR
jgi:SAM-dependent methyltransferase